MFDIHKVKPVHGWREFIGEVGVIVLGVLIALGAEQVVEAIHWRHEVETGRDAVREDLMSLAGVAMEREASSACIGRRLHDLAVVIDGASTTGVLPPLGPIGSPPKRLWHLQAWDTLVAAQTATHFPKDNVEDLNDLDAYVRTVDQLNTIELTDWTTLWTMVGPGRKLASGEETVLRSALSRAGYDAKLLRVNVNQILAHIREDHLLTNADLASVRHDIASRLRNDRAKSLCNPVGPPPDHYGNSPFKLDLLAPFPAA